MRVDRQDPVVVVSADSHVGPRLVEDLRPYCPARHLDDFDAFVEDNDPRGAVGNLIDRHPNLATSGHYDSEARLADYDHDGVAASVLFHGSQNNQPIPFVPAFGSGVGFDADAASVGYEIYNRWLADFVSRSPHRHVGLAYLPAWDLEAAIRTVEWAHDAGLRGLNFPAPREGVILEYNDRAWEPFWSVCEERGMPLVTHVGGNGNERLKGPEALLIHLVEAGGWMARRAIWWLIYGGVFERHPALRLVITETPGNWWPATADEIDSLYDAVKSRGVLSELFERQVPRRPSEYMAGNVFFGASFAAAFEVEEAIRRGYHSQLMWGTDYPHVEGTWVNPDSTDMPSVTRLALRNTFSDVSEEHMRRMVGETAIAVYRLDRAALQRIAREIGAPTPAEIATPIDAVPAGASVSAFRTDKPWT